MAVWGSCLSFPLYPSTFAFSCSHEGGVAGAGLQELRLHRHECGEQTGGYSLWEFTLLLDGFLTQPGEISDYVDIKDSQVRHLEDIVGGRVSGISCSGAVSN